MWMAFLSAGIWTVLAGVLAGRRWAMRGAVGLLAPHFSPGPVSSTLTCFRLQAGAGFSGTGALFSRREAVRSRAGKRQETFSGSNWFGTVVKAAAFIWLGVCDVAQTCIQTDSGLLLSQFSGTEKASGLGLGIYTRGAGGLLTKCPLLHWAIMLYR